MLSQAETIGQVAGAHGDGTTESDGGKRSAPAAVIISGVSRARQTVSLPTIAAKQSWAAPTSVRNSQSALGPRLCNCAEPRSIWNRMAVSIVRSRDSLSTFRPYLRATGLR